MLLQSGVFAFLLIYGITGQKPSPCPDIFQYEEKGPDDNKWYGVINFQSDDDLSGVWVKIDLDMPAEALGNWFGEATSKNNKEFTIRRTDFNLTPGKSVKIKFFVKFDLSKTIPSVSNIRFNGRLVCSEGRTTTERVIVPSSAPLSLEPDITIATPRSVSPIPEPPIRKAASNNNQLRPILPTLSQKCGVISDKVTPLILRGFEVKQAQFPWHIALYIAHPNGTLGYTCGGTLISLQYVVTAAHCVTIPTTNKVTVISRMQVYLGTSNLIQFDQGVQIRQIKEAVVHPNYDPIYFYNDIAMIKLGYPVEVSDYIRPICLWEEEGTQLEKIFNRFGIVVGWGKDGNRSVTTELRGVKIPVIPTSTCIFSNRNFYSQVIFEKNFCAGYTNGTSPCNGDSGGGMVFPKDGTTGSSTVWQLRGVVSVAVNLDGSCNPYNYIVFTDVAQYRDWLTKTMDQ